MSPTQGPPLQLSPAPHGVPQQTHFLSWFRMKTLCVTLNKQHVLYMIIVNANIRKLADSFFLHVEPFLLSWCCLLSHCKALYSTVCECWEVSGSLSNTSRHSPLSSLLSLMLLLCEYMLWRVQGTQDKNTAQTSCRASAHSLQCYKMLNWINWFMV